MLASVHLNILYSLEIICGLKTRENLIVQVIWTKNFSWKQFLNNFLHFSMIIDLLFFNIFLGTVCSNSCGSAHNIWYVVFSLLKTSKHPVISFFISSPINAFLKRRLIKIFPELGSFST